MGPSGRIRAARNAALILVGLGLARSAASAPAASAGIHWESSYKAALTQARKARKPLLIEFFADWCGPCRMMVQTTFRDRSVVDLSRKFVSVRVNLDKAPDLARKFGVTSIPHSLILEPGGKVVKETVGYQDAGAFRLFMLQGLP